MKKTILAIFLFNLCIMVQAVNNPFFTKYNTPLGTPPFDKIKTEHYEPAFKEGILRLDKEIKTIADNQTPATFKNTIEALDQSGEMLRRVSSAFFNVLSADASDEMLAISQRVSPLLTESSNNIYMNEKLFQRVKAIYDAKESLNLTTEQKKLLEDTYETFKEQGATLNAADKETFRKLSTELSLLALQYDENDLKDLSRFEMLITDEKDLEGLPPSIRENAMNAAKEKGKQGWLFNLSAPSYSPFMRYSAKRDLREKMYRAFTSVGNKGDEYDNKEIVKKIVNDRLTLAQLMGFKNYAEYEELHTMAKNPSNVYKLLDELLKAYKPVAINEYNEVKGFATGLENKDMTIMPWDWNFYSEKLKDLRFHVNDEMTRPYFELNHVRESIFGLATQLYGITFKKSKRIPVYNKEVETYEVFDADGSFLGVLYTDFFTRPTKQSGAWMNNIKAQYMENGKDSRPQILLVMNFTRPTGDKPVLLTFDEVNTFIHEFGHSLHGMLSKCTYESISGTSVYRDFVELPSQIMENWLTQREFLNQIAVHYQTGEKIPEEMVKSLVDASNFNCGYYCCRQISFGLLDMAWHTLQQPFSGDVLSFEQKAWTPASLLPQVENSSMSTNFSHIFSGGYSAGYYGYKWAEVLDADAFAAFKEHGIFNKETAKKFRDNILSKGGTEDPSILYRNFRGRDATIDALLIRNGIKKETSIGQ